MMISIVMFSIKMYYCYVLYVFVAVVVDEVVDAVVTIPYLFQKVGYIVLQITSPL